MSEWKEATLGDLITLQRGHDLPKSKMQIGNIPVAGSNGIIGYHNIATTKGIGITIGRSGNIGNAYLYKNDFWAHNTTLYVKDFKGNNEIFVYYFLKNIDFKSFNVGSAVPTLNRNHIHPITINLPPLPEQKAIAEILSSLDDKIDLLHRQNKTLEQMAETLFRQWFVEEAEEDWEVSNLSDIAEVKNGFSFSSKSYIEYTPDALEVLKMGHIEKGGGLRINPKKSYAPRNEKLKRYTLNKGDIIMAMTDMKDNVVILGVPAMIDKSDHYVLNQRVARIYLKSNDKLINNYLLYIQLKDKENIAILQSKANSGVQVNLSTQAINDIEIIVPPMQIQQEKGRTITDLYLRKENNDKHIHIITNMRDTLLPKLMSGEIRIGT